MSKSVPSRVEGVIDPPKTLSARAVEAWHGFSQVLSTRGQLSLDSYWSLAALCECWAEWIELQEDIAQHGRTQKVRTRNASEGDGELGVMERLRPQVGMLQDAHRQLRAWLIEFGLTDASRGKVSGTPEDPDGDPLAKYVR